MYALNLYDGAALPLYNVVVIILRQADNVKKTRMPTADTTVEQLNKLYDSGALTQEECKNELTKYFGGKQ